VITFDELHWARLGVRDDTVVRCGGADRRCHAELAYIDTLPNGVRWLFFDPGWHDAPLGADNAEDVERFAQLRAAYPSFARMGPTLDIWRPSRHASDGNRRLRRPSLHALPNGGPHAGAFRRAARFPALAVCWDGHINVLDAAQLRVK